MMYSRLVVVLCCVLSLSAARAMAQGSGPLPDDVKQSLVDGLAELKSRGVKLTFGAGVESRRGESRGVDSHLVDAQLVDAAIFAKGIRWALDYDTEFSPADITLLKKSLERATERARRISDNERSNDNGAPASRTGKMTLGYVSRVDGSVQPYGLIVPAHYDSQSGKKMRLDVVLHGSTRPVGLSELRFMARFDEGDGGPKAAPSHDYIELHPLGRVENCYRWAGETDVFEAIDDVCRRFHVDRDRIVLRGMSMGASGTWHLGLKHPARFVALGPYCGYVDTHRFSETPLPNFVKIGELPDYQELGLHMLDSVDYAANAGIVPAIACMGEKDVFFDAHVIMGKAMEKEGLKMVNLISPGTGHVIDPVTHAEQMKQIHDYVVRGLDHHPSELRFVTWTLKYSRCHWLSILSLQRHYHRAEFQCRLNGDCLEVVKTTNIDRFSIDIAALPTAIRKLRIQDHDIDVPARLISSAREKPSLSSQLVLTRSNDTWNVLEQAVVSAEIVRKRPGIQGPIDDAFTEPFICVRGTGTRWYSNLQRYADAALQRFAKEWRQYFRGDLPVKFDHEITEDDLRTKNVILFGDPGSNTWIGKAAGTLAVQWEKDHFTIGGKRYTTVQHSPVMIAPSPFAGGEKYVVINSGHTFHDAELGKLNYLLFPRLGDWAVMSFDRGMPDDLAKESVQAAGFCDERWGIH